MEQAMRQRLVVCKEGKLTSFQEEKEVTDRGRAANNSWSKAKYLALAAESFFEKKAKGDQEPRIFCWRTAPMWESEASTARDIEVLGSG